MKSPARLARQMAARGWTAAQIEEAVRDGQSVATVNVETSGPATRYTHPRTGRSVVIDDVTGDVIHVGGDGFIY
ncbi:colicin E5-related ribonuclease [Brevundimonas aurifodinae]|uniref:colicin E5-related ribonuclease n=1 Tax=Brevundimonas aurifodinae TaxID=1508312 RepID=UPI0032E4EF81